ncbi:deoxyribonuclease IV [Tessaracoccus oleiagri]|uniref:Deoxyribonuclease-4 n=1 Tax=Tessaracoccus oleiagri TaxID=686624 RepID=A0A1G9HS50_9ACTN|nr:deoxyribonuclease IV [Tessaracoccus oleiagri]SDL15837.1 deoxyribonuclease-4 [Tessaracoccus oleiagri]
MTIRFGAHSHSANPLDWARDLGTNVLQFYLDDPQGWKKPDFTVDISAAAAEGIDVYVHAPYVVNVASTNNRVRIPSRKLLQQHVTEAARVGAKGVVVHGGHVTGGDDLVDGFTNWRKAIDGLDLPIPILIENTAGGTYAMARFLESLQVLWAAIEGSDNIGQVGFCLDTCHAFAAGLDMTTLVDDVRAITGRIDLVHLNDSKGAAGSGVDRHANLGTGQVPAEQLVEVARTAGAPLILETPGGMEGHVADIAWLRERL